MAKVLVTCDMPESFLAGLRGLNFEVDYQPGTKTDAVKSVIHNYHGLVVSTPVKVDKQMLDAGEQLKFVARAGSGMENIDVAYATQVRVHCVSSPEGNRESVAEHVIGMLLMLLNKLNIADREVREGRWRREENRGVELMGKTIGIIGFGNTGSALARKLSGFDMQILAYDKYKTGFGSEYVKEVELSEIFEEADILSFHVPLTEETKFWANKKFFNSFTKEIILVNSSRGKVVKTDDLVSALKTGKIKGACLDVLEDERITPSSRKNIKWFEELAQMTNVILTPHIAGWTHESKEKIGAVLLKKIKNVTTGS